MPDLVFEYPRLYAWAKIIHIIAMVSWFAGLFYLPRLFVYHAMTKNEVSNNQFKTMEHKLFWYIMTPAGIVTILMGEILAHGFGFYGMWLHFKVMCVALLIVYHIYCFKLMDDFAKDCNQKSHKWYRVFNEVPTLLLILCTILVVLKPGS